MAQLVETPKELVEVFSYQEGEDFGAYRKRSDEALEKLEAESAALPEGEVVGVLISFPWADGRAFYQVTSAKPLKLRHIPYLDAWHIAAATIRGLRLGDVRQQVRAERTFKALFQPVKPSVQPSVR